MRNSIKFLPVRRKKTHKYDYGSVLIAAGSLKYPGAAALCACAALKSGAGMATLAFPRYIYRAVAPKAPPEIVLMPLPDGGAGFLNMSCVRSLEKKITSGRFDAVAAGCGMGVSRAAASFAGFLNMSFRGRVVLDADMLNSIALFARPSGWPERCGGSVFRNDRAIFTPHIGEAARLLGVSSDEISADRKKSAASIARRYGCVCVLKGAGTVISDGKRSIVNATGNPGMATAGSGDVLAGVAAALACVYENIFDAAVAAARIHGMAGDIAADKVSETSLMASDILESLPAAFRRFEPPR
ncbi:MAG: NAD(P)H-hydrate dehydratase [Endomicrobiia bacterium]|nr:NAD(P)H-hydrate dehydratase [Endomicrobiia bacterium]